MRVVRSPRAEQDLIEIWVYISQFGATSADSCLRELDKRGRMLAEFPMLGRARPDIRDGLRAITSGNYLILYKIADDAIEIVRYVHGRRDLKDIA